MISAKLYKCFKCRLRILGLILILILQLNTVKCFSVGSMQQQPMVGQFGFNPTNYTNFRVEDLLKDVNISIYLDQLYNVDVDIQQFMAQYVFQLSWYDDQALDSLQTFVDIQAVTAPSQSQSCNTYCDSRIPTEFDPYNTSPPTLPSKIGKASFYWCCDPIWLPDLYIANLVQMSQDRWGTYWIGFEQDARNRTIVHYTFNLQGLFHTSMDFLSFPFDIQALELQILASNVRKFNYDTTYVCGQSVSSKQSYLYQFQNRGTALFDYAYGKQIQQWNILSFGYGTQMVNDNKNKTQSTFSPSYLNSDTLKFKGLNAGIWSYVQPQIPQLFVFVKISRISSFFILNGLVPILIIVWTSFLVYFINRSKLTDRLGLVVTLLIALSAGNFFSTVPAQTFNVVYNYLAVLSYALISFVGAESLLVYFIMKRGKHVVRNNERQLYQRNWSIQDKYSRNESTASSYRKRGSQRDQFRSIKIYNNSMNDSANGNRGMKGRRGSMNMSNDDLIQNLKNLFQQRSKQQKTPVVLDPLKESSKELTTEDIEPRPSSELALRDQEYGDQVYTLDGMEQSKENQPFSNNTSNTNNEEQTDGEINGNAKTRGVPQKFNSQARKSIAKKWYQKPFVMAKNFLMRIEDPNQADLIGFNIDRISLIITFTAFHAFLIVFAVVVVRHNRGSYC